MSNAVDHLRAGRRYVVLGLLCIGVMVLGIGLWSVKVNISGAIVTGGTVEIAQKRQPVQHAAGGTVTSVLVSNGESVVAGQVLMRLDTATARAELAFAEEHLFELQARQERLKADYTDAGGLQFPGSLQEPAANDPRFLAILREQQTLYDASRQGFRAQIRQLDQRRNQIGVQVLGTNTQIAALSTQLRLVETALKNQQSLLSRGLVSSAPVLELERELASLQGRYGQLVAMRAEAVERQAEIAMESTTIADQRREKMIAKARDIDATVRRFHNEARRWRDEIAAADLRAPIDGVVHDLRNGGGQTIINPAEPVLFLMPHGQAALVRSRISPGDIEQVEIGQRVKLRLSALDQRMTPEVFGQISEISADTTTDERSGARFFEIEVRLSESALDALPDGSRLIHGMPVETFIQTGDRTPLAYLIKPLADYFARAFRES